MIRAGDTVRCIDASAHEDWARWYADDAYCDLTQGKRYLVHSTLVRDGKHGVDIGLPTPWGDPYWAAERFERCLLRMPSFAGDKAQEQNP